ncbi:hypothetical protein HanIR_Chr10g0481871 [Helianthus annuus]|nr:hypothetical protein HanIR_Chr10g0481871 [Helianthus annuus]
MPLVPKYKHLSDHQKRKKRKLEEEKRKADEVKQNRIHKFFFSKETQNSSSNLGDDNVGEDNVKGDEEANVGEDHMNVGVDNVNASEDNVNATVDEEATMCEDDVNLVPDIDIFYPRNWGGLSNDMIKELVMKGPKRDRDVVKGPVDKFGRHFSNTMSFGLNYYQR